ncbi:UNVERIFIED_CONTAM: hypothetical protein Scaly_0281300 [Sesamum calycinum]|uniref:Secreted protein n=1 Tax=Sesamum calycinum TaxID=2727403 RepID=A0AAW2SB09_9LAMI
MLRRAFTISVLSNSAVVLGWCRTGRRKRRRKGGAIRLGNRRRGFWMGPRPVVHWGFVTCPLRALKRIMVRMRLVEAYCWSLPLLRPQLFPLC